MTRFSRVYAALVQVCKEEEADRNTVILAREDAKVGVLLAYNDAGIMDNSPHASLSQVGGDGWIHGRVGRRRKRTIA